ncbi:tetraacyldisaccharide 4'-kinase [Pontibacter sp. E15-1]|uniref:tetraacyldisaccharide 4'-kinase n=1 Tax=Pontibacter sp. E15-1 TaxID=2919918 RepID=UPI001F500805|nr:tetraacyldisaccharide 4'-kinase [Pontibacter sp. E15-1]MCJ8163518.1 tetraacyldisaccharide 4'-kinase [Pontibacter sp. E15-1]
MNKLKRILWPFALLYGGVMQVRNLLYDKQVFPTHSFLLPVVAVGNLTVGGTGKTPHVEYLLRLLQGYKLATLSRGYKRQTKGFLLAGTESTAASLGDEPYQYHQDFPGVTVAVCEDRVAGIQNLLDSVPGLEVVVLDDAMQHRPVHPSLNLMLTDYTRPFYEDLVLPAGLLREPRRGAARADAVIVSKCPPKLSQAEQDRITEKTARYTAPGTPVFFTTYTYGAPVPLGLTEGYDMRIVLLTGLAHATPLKEYLQAAGYDVLRHLDYPDHHAYTQQDMYKLQALLQQPDFQGAQVLTTRKDTVKLVGLELEALTRSLPISYVPVVVRFLQGQEQFDQLVTRHVAQLNRV